eukprot:TRINITY_DN6464_c0_g1_i6.p1 TRINITY_DN6464_c0_g1~~TRINITY_DN6464_c0_g1_i6.p1  ORF type:complete len:900 (-),score=203.33 TRINITY_DN6464_c0_g1_i6:101-2800(-)
MDWVRLFRLFSSDASLCDLAEALISVRRVHRFVSAEDKQKVDHQISPEKFIHVNSLEVNYEKETTTEEKNEVIKVLRDASISVSRNEFAVVSGKVGCGKTTLLLAMLREVKPRNGSVSSSGSVAYVPQEPWIQNGTVKENIVFGKEFQRNWYDMVVYACALHNDLKTLVGGDSCEIGERGINLSGGQKARIALARAVYANADVYLLDDPLSAVDSGVAQHIVRNCFMGILKHKVRVLITHHIHLFEGMEKEVLFFTLENGSLRHTQILSSDTKSQDYFDEKEFKEFLDSKKSKNDLVAGPSILQDDEGKLVETEKREAGHIDSKVISSYMSKVGIFTSILIALSIILMQASRNLNDWWVAVWVTDISSDSGRASFDLKVLTVIAASNSIFTLVRSFIFAYGGIVAARRTFAELLENVLAAPVTFFEVNPLGRVLNRFSADTFSIDDQFPFMSNILWAMAIQLIGTCVVIVTTEWYFFIMLIPLLLSYIDTQKIYRIASRELKRLDTVTSSPIYSKFSETLDGMISIRAFRQEERFMAENDALLQVNQEVQFVVNGSQRWLDVKLSFISIAVATGLSLLSVLRHQIIGNANAALVGLSLAYAFPMTSLLKGLIWSYSETEKQLVSCERVFEYTELESERKLMNDADREPFDKSWPSTGEIEFRNFRLSYRKELPAVLKRITVRIRSGERVGICGRTGSGKSSLYEALFRMRKYTSGEVLVDGVDIAKVPLQKLRSSLCIIPQQPILIKGTIRENLDPYHRKTDDQVWDALKKCGLESTIGSLEKKLQSEVRSGAENFSLGERQLLTLARAFLQESRIVCLDEATASIDLETDKKIQKALREEFRDRTVLMIAHRIETILDTDRIMVIQDGVVAKFDTPQALLQDAEFRQQFLGSGNSEWR